MAALKTMMDTSVSTGLQPIKQDIVSIKSTMADHTKRIENLEKASRSVAADGAGSESSNGSSFEPAFFNIDNFCDFGKRKTDGITRLEAEDYMKKVKERIPACLLDKIKDFSLFGIKSHKIQVHVKHPFAVELGMFVRELLQDPEFEWKGRKLWTSVHRFLEYTPCRRQADLSRLPLRVWLVGDRPRRRDWTSSGRR